MVTLDYLSLFSGIEAFTAACRQLDESKIKMNAKAYAQHEPDDNVQFSAKVLAHHYPNAPNLGDVTKITEEQIAALGHIDIVVGGSPCQDLSIQGRHAGLHNDDGSITRSGLFDYQMQIFEWAKEHCGARWLLWENVCGAFSSNNGDDFGYILGSMVKGDVPTPREGWGGDSGVCISTSGDRLVEWAVVDAKRFLPQRRRRVFVLLDVGEWWRRRPILLEPSGLPRVSETGDGFREGTSSTVQTSHILNGEPIVYEQHARDSRVVPILDDTCPTLTTRIAMCAPRAPLVRQDGRIRILTPTEAERLMGFSEGYTDIPWKNKPHAPDGHRYKALGNSMAVPVMKWIQERIAYAIENPIKEDSSEHIPYQPSLF